MSRELLRQLADKERELRTREFIAPYHPGCKSAIIKMEGVHYKFRIVGLIGSGSNIGLFQPVDPTCAKFVRDVDFDLRRRYLDILPHIHLILAYETERGWVAFPMNRESALVKFNLDSEVLVKGVTDVERFDTIIARYDGLHFWFDEPFAGADPVLAHHMRECFRPDWDVARMEKEIKVLKGLSAEQRRTFELAVVSWTLFRKLTTEDRIKRVLESGGGTLGRYVLRGDNLEIKWSSPSGRLYTSLINKDTLDVVSAGICLSGEDRKFHLKDLPFIMDQGERQNAIHVYR